MNGNFNNIRHGSPMMFCWIVWEKGFREDPVIKWFQDEEPWKKIKAAARL